MNGYAATIHAPTEVAEFLALLGIPVEQLFQLAGSQRLADLSSVGIVHKVPAREAFDAFEVEMNKSDPISGRHLGALSKQEYFRVIQRFKDFCFWRSSGEAEVYDVTSLAADFIFDVEDRMGVKESTLNKYIAIIRRFMTFCLHVYPGFQLCHPRYRDLPLEVPRALPQSEVVNLMRIAKSSRNGVRSFFMVTLLYSTGLRRDEFRLLRVRDILWKELGIRVKGKGNKERVVPIPDSMIDILRSYLELFRLVDPIHYVYGHGDSPYQPLSKSALNRQFQRLVSKLPTYSKDDSRFGYTMHSMRHTYACQLQANRVPLRVIAKCLGHQSTTTTERYTVLDVSGLREAAREGLDTISMLLRGEFRE